MDKTKIINILDPQSGRLEETVIEHRAPEQSDLLLEANGRSVSLHEAAEITTAMFPQLLRTGLKPILFSEYSAYPNTHEQWIGTEASDQEFVTGIEADNLGKAPVVAENQPYPEVTFRLNRSVQIHNQKRGFILPVTWEMVKYDKVGMIRQAIGDIASAMAYTEESDAYDCLRTAGNYTRTVAAGDNDIANNTAATTFSGLGLTTAFAVLRTMKDQASGRYLGVAPDTLIVGTEVEFAAKQLLTSSTMQGSGNADATVLHGNGATNPFVGLVNQIIVTPMLTKYEWVLLQRGKAVKKFVVQDLELLEESQGANSTAYFERKAIRYRVDKVYGIGMWNDRFAYYSSSTTAPTID